MEEVETRTTDAGVEVAVGDAVVATVGSIEEADVLAAWVRFQLKASVPVASIQSLLRGEATKDGATSGGVEVAPPAEAKKAAKPAARAKKREAKAPAEERAAPVADVAKPARARRRSAAKKKEAEPAEDKPARPKRRAKKKT